MSIATKSRPRVKPARSIRLALAPTGGGPGVVDITHGHTTTSYFLRVLDSDFGQAFELEKFNTQGGELYHVNLNGPDSTAWTQAYIESGADRKPLVQRLALLACRMGNDPHNQEIGQVLLEDYGKNQSRDRERLLLACAHISAGHRKYGDFFEASRRFGEAMGLAELH